MPQQGEQWARVERRLGAGEICKRCGATLETYAEVCKGALDEMCEGFRAIEAALRETEGDGGADQG